MAGGQRFQAQVAAWWMARILLGTRVGARFAMAPALMAHRLIGESGDEVDDVRVELSDRARLYGQCKRSLRAGTSVEGEWSSVLLQFARQAEADSAGAGERRYVLFYEAHNGTLTRIAQLLERYRPMPEGASLLEAATNAEERRLAEELCSLLDELAKLNPLAALSAGRQALLRKVCVTQLRLAEGEADFLSVQDALQYGLLSQPSEAPTAMRLLHRQADDLLAERRSCDRAALLGVLAGQVALRQSCDYLRDFERLGRWSEDELSAHELQGRARLQLGAARFSIERPVLRALLDAPMTSFVVVGDAGTGKTGCLIHLAHQLQARGQLVWYWAADSLPEPSPTSMGNVLGLQHSWSGIFGEARATGGVALIIDGLDGVRDARAQGAYQKLLTLARGAGVRVITSIRRVDAQYASWLKHCFARQSDGAGEEIGGDSASTILGARMNALRIDELTEQELQQVLKALPALGRALAQNPALRPVIRNLFSLDLLCQLLQERHEPTALSRISTQVELFERYWERRIQDHPLHDELESWLTGLVEKMVQTRALQVAPRELPKPLRTVLLSTGLIRNPPAHPGRLPEEERVEFAHHLFFDYAAERLFVRRRRQRLTAELASNDPWPLMLRPSLVLFLRHAWVAGRLDFWDLLLELERSGVSGLHRLSAYVVIAEEARSEAELARLMEGATGAGEDRACWRRALKGVAMGAAFVVLPRLFSQGAGAWWLRLAHELVRTEQPELVEAASLMLSSADEHMDTIGAGARVFLQSAAISMARYQARQDLEGDTLRPALRWICRTASVDRDATHAVILELLLDKEFSNRPAACLLELANHLGALAAADAPLARWLYEVAFTCDEARAFPGVGRLGDRFRYGTIAQEARYQLVQDFPSFFRASAAEATRAVLHVARQSVKERNHRRGSKSPAEPLWLGANELTLIEDECWRGSFGVASLSENLIEDWQSELEALPGARNGQEVLAAIWSVLVHENDLPMLWNALLAATVKAPGFFGPRALELLVAPAILVGRGTHRFARKALEALREVLSPGEFKRIETTIVGIKTPAARGPRTRVRGIKRARVSLLRKLPKELLGVEALRLSERFGSKNADADEDAPRINIITLPQNMKEVLKKEKIDEHAPEHAPFIELGDRLYRFSVHKVVQEASEVLDAVKEAEALLATAPGSVAPLVVELIQRHVLQALSALAHAEVRLGKQQQAALAARFESALVAPTKPKARSFHSWGATPQDARVSAASGIVGLALRPGGMSSREEAIQRIARSPLPEVRRVLIQHLWGFFTPKPEIVFETLEYWIEDLEHQREFPMIIGDWLIDGWHLHLRTKDVQRADRLLSKFLERAHQLHNKDLERHDFINFRRIAGAALGQFHCVSAHHWTEKTLSRLLKAPSYWANELDCVLWQAARVLLPRGRSRKRPLLAQKPEIVERAQALVVRILQCFAGALQAHDLERASHEYEEPELDRWRYLLEGNFKVIADCFNKAAIRWLRTLAPELMATACPGLLYDEEENGDRLFEDLSDQGAEAPMAGFVSRAAAMRAWWAQTEPVLEVLLKAPAPLVAPSFVEGLRLCAYLDAPRTMSWLRRYVDEAVTRGRLSDKSTADIAVGLLAQVFADDDGELASQADFRADYLHALDAYLSIGWPKAVEIALQVETLFRSAAD